ncbi:hypothetical protein L202_07070 [Cryptococcus amylolentus CBS 6039]|uniref:DinB-like domain-containing protein n=1 Tax=Cryptococcus amylolentus CBS 6039 TaxID=1295533 RepID=A0A1E3HEH5_9TREE|nr:hypothetical protein L202_07070 [Cryptococcus amylolentus CBS 6039]ODN74747.1 hypothetical protein L202_07070 [Cryptococcus amylolentus CBS 6039]
MSSNSKPGPSSASRTPLTTLDHTLVPMPSRTHPDRAEALVSLSIALIDSAVDILERNISTDEELSRDSALLPGGTVGKHFRHVIESFRAFLLNLYDNPRPLSEVPEINYDNILPTTRRPIARSLPACRQAMRQISKDLTAWSEICRRRGSVMGGSGGSGGGVEGNPAGLGGQKAERRNGLVDEMDRVVHVVAITPTKQEMGSTVGRELWYCSLHSIHHFSMLRTIAVYELDLTLPVEFGTAPSTLLYRGLSWKPPTEGQTVKVIRTSKL